MDWMCSYNMKGTCHGWKKDGWKWGVKHIHAFTQETHSSINKVTPASMWGLYHCWSDITFFFLTCWLGLRLLFLHCTR